MVADPGCGLQFIEGGFREGILRQTYADALVVCGENIVSLK